MRKRSCDQLCGTGHRVTRCCLEQSMANIDTCLHKPDRRHGAHACHDRAHGRWPAHTRREKHTSGPVRQVLAAMHGRKAEARSRGVGKSSQNYTTGTFRGPIEWLVVASSHAHRQQRGGDDARSNVAWSSSAFTSGSRHSFTYVDCARDEGWEAGNGNEQCNLEIRLITCCAG